MRNTLPLSFRTPVSLSRARSPALATPPQIIPTIKLTAATPSVAGTPSDISTILSPKPPGEVRKKVVPKKSKIGLLSVGSKKQEKGKDLSDVKRRVGVSSSSTSRSFDIYVDPTDDPDIGEVVFVQKKKSRAGLDGVFKSALGDVTNTVEEKLVPTFKSEKAEKISKSISGTLKVKDKREEKEKWWTLGRSRRDSKEKTKEKACEGPAHSKEAEQKAKKSIEPIIVTDSRQRAHSFDSGILLNTPTTALSHPVDKPLPELKLEEQPPTVRINTSPTIFGSRPSTPTSSALLALPSSDKPQGGSIALRAMRSIARIGSWAQLRNTPSPEDVDLPPEETKKEKKIFGKTKRTKSVRSTASSFEAGGLSPVGGNFVSATTRTSKSSTGTIMTVSSIQSYVSGGSSGVSACSSGNRLSVASSVGTVSSESCKSVADPILINGRQSTTRDSASSVRWDDQVDTVKDKKIEPKKGKETRGKVEGRRRPAISALFPDAIAPKEVNENKREINPDRPLLTLSAASPDRNGENEMEVLSMTSMSSAETPAKKPRPRPLSENMLCRMRPRGITGDDVEDGFMSILDAATTDLANLINRLDLQATPDASPMRTSPGTLRSAYSSITRNDDTGKFSLPESPSRRAMKTLSKESSVCSLRPYSSPKSKSSSSPKLSKLQLGEQIAPWPAFSSHLETLYEASPVATKPKVDPVFHPCHKRTLSPPAPAMDPPPVFHPLPAAKAKNAPLPKAKSPTTKSDKSTPRPASTADCFEDASSRTFGVRPSRVSNGMQEGEESPTANGRFRSHERKRSSLVPFDVDSTGESVLMDSTARRALGMRGTMGSVGSTSAFDPDEPDSDIPDELHVILCASRPNSACSTLDAREDSHAGSLLPPSPGVPPCLPLPSVALTQNEVKGEAPVFRALVIDDDQNEADIDDTSDLSDDDGKSFDFTGEIKQLNESGAADRRSFVMQLEDAFKTQAQIDIKGLGANIGLYNQASLLPPLPALPISRDDLDDSALPALSEETRLDDLPLKSHLSRDHIREVPTKTSDGELNRDFKFGGRPSPPKESTSVYVMEKSMTLSDIIPPLSHVEHIRRQSMSSILDEDNSVLRSIYAQAFEYPAQHASVSSQSLSESRPRLESDSSDKQRARQEALSQLTAHSRQESEVSFSGMSSFDEVRRGFEFNDSRPVFYPPANASQASVQSDQRYGHGQQDSVFSIASVSSYGAVVKSGSLDPFGFALPNRPISDDMSFSVDDTFSFLHRDPARKRVDSDASSFYFNSSRDVSKRHRRQNDSMASAFSGPPVSMYNRSYGAHRRSDSSASVNSIGQAYGAFGANGGRVSWARHQRDYSVDSVQSGYSARLGRPGVGDKMFESAHEYGMPLTSITASPSQSVARDIGNKTSFDSILDTDHRSSMADSLFDETGRRTSVSSASVFGYENHHPMPRAPGLLPPHQFRPVSMISVNSSHGTKAEDDTMITMFDGGHVRRRSLGSAIEGSPCARVHQTHRFAMAKVTKEELTSDDDNECSIVVDKAQVVEKPSFASSMSHKFGEDRMSMAQKGLLQRQSLEDSCLSGEGEDMSFSAPIVFRRPSPTSCPRDSQSSLSSGVDTPPLSISDSSSLSSGSQSSIDVSRLSALLANSTVPACTTAQARARARGQGHRRRISQAQASRSRNSVYETIEEEGSGVSQSTSPIKSPSKNASSPVSRKSFYEPSIHVVEWDQEDMGPALRKYFALRNEAYEAVSASKQIWADTPFSLFALQSFEPPAYPHGMQAVLEHSQKTYGPLPSELRALRRRSRTLSRPSPYPRARKTSETSLHSRRSSGCDLEPSILQQLAAPLQELSVNRNIPAIPKSPVPSLNPLNPFTPFAVKFNNGDKSMAISEKDLPTRATRPRVASNARRTALGWSKRSTAKSASENKENASFGAMMTPNESLRIVRPRPRGRATPSTRAVRV